jgi:hypothetical protein
MKIKTFKTEEEWILNRRTKITGTRLGGIIVKRGSNEKAEFYKLVAERISKPGDGENPMNRGQRLEQEAVEILEKKLNKVFIKDLVTWERDDNENIAISPDAYSVDLKEAVEVKCLSSHEHIETFLKQEIQSEYEFQALQYFIVNDDLETLYFTLYDPRLIVKEHFYITIKREDVQEKISEYLEYQRTKLIAINEIVNKLSF